MTKYIKKIFAIALGSFTVVGVVPAAVIATVKPNLPAADRLIAHRGYSAKYFQNTYEAFNEAVGKPNSKFWGAETDLQMDKEKTIWCSHYINPFEDQSKRINEMTTNEIEGDFLKTNGSIDTSNLPSKAFPTGALNPYKVNIEHDDAKLCKFWDSTSEGKGYLNTFLDNDKHPIIELKIESTLINDVAHANGCMKMDNDTVKNLIKNTLDDLRDANNVDKNHTLFSRCYFVSFFDDLLAEAIKQIKERSDDFPNINNNQFQKLLDDGGIGQYVLSDSFDNTTPGKKEGSNSNFKNYQRYTDGSWCESYEELGNYKIGLDVYYALINSKMITNAHNNGVEINCWTADYTRTEIAEALSLDILARAKIDYITTDDWYDLR